MQATSKPSLRNYCTKWTHHLSLYTPTQTCIDLKEIIYYASCSDLLSSSLRKTVIYSDPPFCFNEKSAAMNKVNYLQQRQTESLPFEANPDIKRLSVYQPQDAFRNQTVLPPDVQQVLVIKEEVPWSPSLDDDDPEPLHLNEEEEEEHWTSQEEEEEQQEEEEEEEGDITRFTFTGVKSEYDTEEHQLSPFYQCKSEEPVELWTRRQEEHLHEQEEADFTRFLFTAVNSEATSSSAKEIKIELDEEDSEGADQARNLSYLQLQTNPDGKTSDSSETEVSDDGDEWQEPVSGSGSETKETDRAAPFSCSECSKQFFYKQSLKRHLKHHSGESSRSLVNFVCDVCGKIFTYHHNLKTHMRLHTGEKPFICNICGKKVRLQTNLKAHMSVHSGEKPFGCDLCGKRFKRKTYLATHMAIHKGEKPFGCDVCGKSFKRKGHLTIHMTVHKGEKPFSCDVCGKAFNRKTHLASHSAVHTGDKPFGCDICGKKFNRKTHLETHITVHTGEKPFYCGVCGQEFTQQGSLNRHMRFHLG
ncbi:zinc finger protein 19-like [Parambassis ranga]|uniref:Zinc finger protein 19-like n=1 Tax=Parambassis ranga TaxID=210632 RepID=A0A6P7KGR0_9TELE|nr:zinc finger protein 19-like [Parambassis ranga]